MASETAAVSEHPTLSEQVKEKVVDEVKVVEEKASELPGNEEVKKVDKITEPEEESIKDKPSEVPVIEETKKPDVEEISVVESGQKIEDKEVVSPVLEDIKSDTVEEAPKVEVLSSPVAPLAEPDENIVDKEIAPSIIEDVPSPAAALAEPEEKTEDNKVEIPVIEEAKIIDKEEKQVVAEEVPSPAAPLVDEHAAKIEEKEKTDETIEEKSIDLPVVEEAKTDETIEEKSIDPPVVEEAKTDETVEDKSIDPPVAEESKAVETPAVDALPKDFVPEPVTETTTKEEDPKVEPVQESEPVEADEVLKPVLAVDEKPEEQFLATEKIEKEVPVVDPKEIEKMGALLKDDVSIKEPTENVTTEDLPKVVEKEEDFTLSGEKKDAENEKEVTKEEVVAAEEPKKPEVEENGTETLKTEESTRDIEVTKIAEDLPKEEVAVKSSQKQSNSLISKVKHSLVKAKKAIIGKSHDTKGATAPPDAKSEVKV